MQYLLPETLDRPYFQQAIFMFYINFLISLQTSKILNWFRKISQNKLGIAILLGEKSLLISFLRIQCYINEKHGRLRDQTTKLIQYFDSRQNTVSCCFISNLLKPMFWLGSFLIFDYKSLSKWCSNMLTVQKKILNSRTIKDILYVFLGQVIQEFKVVSGQNQKKGIHFHDN